MVSSTWKAAVSPMSIVAVVLLLWSSSTVLYASGHTMCSDGFDNDMDGRIDYPQDSDCRTAQGNTEGGTAPLQISVTDGRETVEAGGKLTYRITVSNVGSRDRNFALHTRLPQEVNFVAAEPAPIRNAFSLQWTNQRLAAGESRVYMVWTVINRDAPGFYSADLRVYVVGTNEGAVDVTYVQSGVSRNAFSVAVDDGQSTVAPGEVLTYRIEVENTAASVVTDVYVAAALPMGTDFVSATEGGRFIGGNQARWDGLTIGPRGRRVLLLTARVRPDTLVGSKLVHSILVQGNRASDVTTVTMQQTKPSTSQQPPAPEENVFLRVRASRGEVEPGGLVTYSVVVRNTTGHPVRNLEVGARVDERSMSVTESDGANRVGSRWIWRIPHLAKGEIWSTHMTVRVQEDVLHGTFLPLVVTVGGKDIAAVSLTERVRTVQTGVLVAMPSTGAPLDVIFLALTSVMSTGPLFVRRKLTLAKL